MTFEEEFEKCWDKYELYNGCVTGITKMPRNEQEKYAKQFAEGSEHYYKLLLELWSRGVETRAGCSGIFETHNERATAYLSIDIFPENRKLLFDLTEKLHANGFLDKNRIEYYAGVLRDESLMKMPDWARRVAFYSYKSDRAALEKQQSRQDCEDFFKAIYIALLTFGK